MALFMSVGSDKTPDVPEKQKSFKRLCVRFAEKTSMTGVPYINSARLIVAKVIWTILLIGAIGAMIFHLYYLCSQFFSWPKITKLTLEFSSLQLPEVTICNSNVVKRSKLYLASKELQNFTKAIDPEPAKNSWSLGRKKRFTSKLMDFNFSAYKDYGEHPLKQLIEEEDLFYKADLGPDNEIVKIGETFKELFMEHDRETRVAMGHNISDMLLSCSFNGKHCYAKHFELFTTAEYGNCYKLKTDGFVAKEPGPIMGLQLILFMENNEYIEGLTEGYGLRISLKQTGHISFPVDDGIFVSAAAENAIGLKMVEVNRKGYPYGVCEDGSWFTDKYKSAYSRQACQKLNTQSHIIKECGCFDEKYQEIYLKANITDSRPCKKGEEKICQIKALKTLAKNGTIPACKNPCSESIYVRQLSSRQWPNKDFSFLLLDSACQKQPKHCAYIRKLTEREMSLHFVKLMVYYEDLNYEVIDEVAEIESAQFVSDVGGALGLWIGLSVLSIFEVFQLVGEIGSYSFHKLLRSEPTEDEKSNKTHSDTIDKKERRNGNPIFSYQGSSSDFEDSNESGVISNTLSPVFRPSIRRGRHFQSVDNYIVYKGPQKQ